MPPRRPQYHTPDVSAVSLDSDDDGADVLGLNATTHAHAHAPSRTRAHAAHSVAGSAAAEAGAAAVPPFWGQRGEQAPNQPSNATAAASAPAFHTPAAAYLANLTADEPLGMPDSPASEGSHSSYPNSADYDMASEDSGSQEYPVPDDASSDPPSPPLTGPLPPPGLKEISSLASWTVSSSKPGCGVTALRSPDTSLFWQSDGPQPHLLSVHFFKLVSILHMRVYLDFENDESYTPTRMLFLAGTGVHDLQEFADMAFDQPRGWIDVDFGNVGPVVQGEGRGEEDGTLEVDWSTRPALRAFLVQVRILENHQNGKDTHLRGLQIFAKDDLAVAERAGPAAPHSGMASATDKQKEKKSLATRPKKASWMMEPQLR